MSFYHVRTDDRIALFIVRRNAVVVIISQLTLGRAQIVDTVDEPGDLQFGTQRPAFTDASGQLVRPQVIIHMEAQIDGKSQSTGFDFIKRDPDVGHPGQMAYRVVDVAHQRSGFRRQELDAARRTRPVGLAPQRTGKQHT